MQGFDRATPEVQFEPAIKVRVTSIWQAQANPQFHPFHRFLSLNPTFPNAFRHTTRRAVGPGRAGQACRSVCSACGDGVNPAQATPQQCVEHTASQHLLEWSASWSCYLKNSVVSFSPKALRTQILIGRSADHKPAPGITILL